jgi:hypothetical protein
MAYPYRPPTDTGAPAAFPLLTPIGYPNAARANQGASRNIYLGPRSAKPNNLTGLARAAVAYGAPSGKAKARQGPRGNVYIETTTLPVEGWGGEQHTTHFSAHMPAAAGSGTTPIGQYHTKTTLNTTAAGVGPTLYEARAIPFRHEGAPGFSQLYTPDPSAKAGKAYPVGANAAAAVAVSRAFGNYARLHPRGPPYGGRKSRKQTKTKKARKASKKTRKH